MKNKIKTDLKCTGCKGKLPKIDVINENPTWFGYCVGDKLLEFICVECWKKGIRYKLLEGKKKK